MTECVLPILDTNVYLESTSVHVFVYSTTSMHVRDGTKCLFTAEVVKLSLQAHISHVQ